jgi:hypothetical protein
MSSFARHSPKKPSKGEPPATIPCHGGQSRDADAESPAEAAQRSNLGRSTIYKAINPDPAKRDGLPFLRSFKVGRRRLILTATRRAWLAELEAAQNPDLQESCDPSLSIIAECDTSVAVRPATA